MSLRCLRMQQSTARTTSLGWHRSSRTRRPFSPQSAPTSLRHNRCDPLFAHHLQLRLKHGPREVLVSVTSLPPLGASVVGCHSMHICFHLGSAMCSAQGLIGHLHIRCHCQVFCPHIAAAATMQLNAFFVGTSCASHGCKT